MICLADIDMYKFETCIHAALSSLDTRAMVKVDIHLYSIFEFIVIDHVAYVIKPQVRNLPLSNLNKDRGVLFLGRRTNRAKYVLVIEIECPNSKMLPLGALHQVSCPYCIFTNFSNSQSHTHSN